MRLVGLTDALHPLDGLASSGRRFDDPDQTGPNVRRDRLHRRSALSSLARSERPLRPCALARELALLAEALALRLPWKDQRPVVEILGGEFACSGGVLEFL